MLVPVGRAGVDARVDQHPVAGRRAVAELHLAIAGDLQVVEHDGADAVGALADVLLVGVLVGVLAAVGDRRVGAWLLLAAVTGLVLTHLAISFVAYRRVMRRAWPQVRPLDDWDD